MISEFLEINKLLRNKQIKFGKEEFNDNFDFYFYHISEKTTIQEIEKQEIENNIKDSVLMIIDQNDKLDQIAGERCLILCLSKSLIIIEYPFIKYLKKFWTINPEIKIYTIKNSYILLNEVLKLDFQVGECKYSDYQEEIQSLLTYLYLRTSNKVMKSIWSCIVQCISFYLIIESRLKLNVELSRIARFELEKNFTPKNIDENEYIILKQIGSGSSFITKLIYHIKCRELYAIKIPTNNDELSKLIQREKMNYLTIKHPFLPKFYGLVTKKNYVVIEFINGNTLDQITNMKLNYTNLITIILNLILVIKHFHDNGYVYRDLKPNNVIFDGYEAVLIDLDRLVSNNNDETTTADLGSAFCAPEICNTGKFSCKSDIYSLGKMIEFVMKSTKNFYPEEYVQIDEIIQNCTKENPEERFSISDLLRKFLSIFKSEKGRPSIQSVFNISPKALEFIYAFNYENKKVLTDFEKSIYYYIISENQSINEAYNILGQMCIIFNKEKGLEYLLKASNENNNKAQFFLGEYYSNGLFTNPDKNNMIFCYSNGNQMSYINQRPYIGSMYYDREYLEFDINKAIYYFTLAANNNNNEAQYILYDIYFIGEFVPKNVNKAIYYLTLSANNGNAESQFYLAGHYFNGSHISFNINKAIQYYTLAANQNYVEAQFLLGQFFYEGKYIKFDIEKAIYYYTLAANNNSSKAQHNLGIIYLNGQYVKANIDMAIYYLTLAANNNCINSQLALGLMYYEGRNVKLNINKATHFLTLAANQNSAIAQYYLGIIYINSDTTKSLQYLSLAANQQLVEAQFFLGNFYHLDNSPYFDINKSIYYYTLAANNNFPQAQYNLGVIYYEKEYGKMDINKSIFYFTLAACSNFVEAQYELGLIYFKGEYVIPNIHKAIHYLTLAANQNNSKAQFLLGIIYNDKSYDVFDSEKSFSYLLKSAENNNAYAQWKLGDFYYEGKIVKFDINKAVYYYTLAANQNLDQAQFSLGAIYQNTEFELFNIDKAVYYYTLAANQGHIEANYNLFLLYKFAEFLPPDRKKSLNYLMTAAAKGDTLSCFQYGFLLHEGISVKRDINSAIHYYKEASSFNCQYAKNNLGVIYKSGFGEIPANKMNAIVYFEEAINQKNDYLAMHNLANIYLYDTNEQNLDKSIELLIKSYIEFPDSLSLLCLALVKKNQFNLDKIKIDIQKYSKGNSGLLPIYDMILQLNLFDKKIFNNFYEGHKTLDFLYNSKLCAIPANDILIEIKPKKTSRKDISPDFYEGFGNDL